MKTQSKLVEICIHHFTKNFEPCKKCKVDGQNRQCGNYLKTSARVRPDEMNPAVNVYEFPIS